MINTLEQFGRNAGKLWSVLNEKGSLTESEIIENTSLRFYEFYIAVGWLSKEDKISKDGDFYSLNKTNLNYNIGENAGKIWKVLYKEGKIDIYKILKLTKMDERDAYSAIGWLARENKIQFNIGNIHHQIKRLLK